MKTTRLCIASDQPEYVRADGIKERKKEVKNRVYSSFLSFQTISSTTNGIWCSCTSRKIRLNVFNFGCSFRASWFFLRRIYSNHESHRWTRKNCYGKILVQDYQIASKIVSISFGSVNQYLTFLSKPFQPKISSGNFIREWKFRQQKRITQKINIEVFSVGGAAFHSFRKWVWCVYSCYLLWATKTEHTKIT